MNPGTTDVADTHTDSYPLLAVACRHIALLFEHRRGMRKCEQEHDSDQSDSVFQQFRKTEHEQQ